MKRDKADLRRGKQGQRLLVNPLAFCDTLEDPAGSAEGYAVCPEGFRCSAHTTVVSEAKRRSGKL